jgi:hypothetical protein
MQTTSNSVITNNDLMMIDIKLVITHGRKDKAGKYLCRVDGAASLNRFVTVDLNSELNESSNASRCKPRLTLPIIVISNNDFPY